MLADHELPRRRSIRLGDHDYAAGGSYFITICTYRREAIFGCVVEARMLAGPLGEIVRDEWKRSSELRPTLHLGAFVVMPNHIHGLVTIAEGDVGARSNAPAPTSRLERTPRTVGAFVGGFKGAVTRRINGVRETPGEPVWQRNYYEHVVRSENEFERIRQYIIENPARWADDEYYT